MKTIKTVILTTFLLASYQSIACGCASYYQTNDGSEPSWVLHEKIDDESAYSRGSTLCTGIKSIDEKRADINARQNLSYIISSSISTNESISNSSVNGISSTRFVENTNLKSQSLLKNSSIYDRWVDVANCIVYSATKVSHRDIKRAMAQQQKEKQLRLVNNDICVLDRSKHKDPRLEGVVVEKLSGIGFHTSYQNSGCLIDLNLTNEFTKKSQTLVKNRLLATLINTQTQSVILQKSYRGKGFSYSHKDMDELEETALEDSIDAFITDISSIKDIEINHL